MSETKWVSRGDFSQRLGGWSVSVIEGRVRVATVFGGTRDEAATRAELIAAAPRLAEACARGHSDSPGLPCGDLLAAANVLRNGGMSDLAERLEAKHAAEAAALSAYRAEHTEEEGRE